ncbi:calmodulin-binding protein [Streptomyces laculatispora]|uniref:Calmodulin-binding protein n=1 Tax=Streptomyces laculatispora TaxID=887464 RepID=A0ABY9I449_9ACTN|nr:calmodulin-binding protein [Streptomyces laculatispora]WLQ41586.1 calmodulin-binding protein [Streptomyces laculatispora]
MRSTFTKLGSLAAVALLGFTVAQPAQAEQHTTSGRRAAAVAPAFFEMTDGYSRQNLVVKLVKEEQIDHARELLSGATNERPHVIGRLKKYPADYNPNYSFHYDPATVGFFDYAIEVCDATLSYTEDHLDEAGGPFLPGLVYCPWNSRLVKEVPAP